MNSEHHSSAREVTASSFTPQECEARQSTPILDTQDDKELMSDDAKAYQRILRRFQSEKDTMV
jgi:hypothetical protein